MRSIAGLLRVLMVLAAVVLAGCDSFLSAEDRIARAEQHITEGNDRSAVIEIQNALRSEPENVTARLMLVELSLQLEDVKSAERELQEALTHGAKAGDVAELSAKVLLATRQFDKLLEQVQSGNITLQEPLRSTYRGLALLGSRKGDAAMAAFDDALKVDPNAARARLGRVEVLASTGRIDAALSELKDVRVQHPKDALAALMQGVLLARQGEFRPAVVALISARQNAPGQLTLSQRVTVLAAQIEAHLGAGEVKEAEAVQAQLVKSAPDVLVTRLLTARIAMVRQDYAVVVAESQRVLSAAPDMVTAKLLLGTALLAQGHLNQAEVKLAEAVQQAPQNIEARKLLARVNMQLQRPDIATQILLPTNRGDRDDSQVDALLGLASLQQGDTRAAVMLLERSVAAHPAELNSKLDLASAYFADGAYEKAIELLRSVPASATAGMRRDKLLIASIAAMKGQEDARREIERLVGARPDDGELLNVAGLFYARLGEFERARKLLQTALEREPSSASTLMNMARVELAANNRDAAVRAVERAVALQPKDTAATLALAELLAGVGDVPKAIKVLQALLVSESDAVESRVLLARLYTQQRQPQEADAAIRQAQLQAKGRPEVASSIADYYVDAGRYTEALAWFREAAMADTRNSHYQLGIARTQLALGDNAAARGTLERLSAAQPQNIAANVLLIVMDVREGRQEAAQRRLRQLQDAHPKNAAVITLRGDLELSNRAYAVADQSYRQAYALAPSAALALRSYRARRLGKLPGATVPLEQWLVRGDRDATVRMALAEALVERGETNLAIQQYEQEMQAERPNPMMLNNLAWLYHTRGDSRALAVAKQAYSAAPNVPAVADTYGWILVNLGKAQEALPILGEAAAGSKQPAIRYHYAAALARAGQSAAARKELIELTSASDAEIANQAREFLGQLGK